MMTAARTLATFLNVSAMGTSPLQHAELGPMFWQALAAGTTPHPLLSKEGSRRRAVGTPREARNKPHLHGRIQAIACADINYLAGNIVRGIGDEK